MFARAWRKEKERGNDAIILKSENTYKKESETIPVVLGFPEVQCCPEGQEIQEVPTSQEDQRFQQSPASSKGDISTDPIVI